MFDTTPSSMTDPAANGVCPVCQARSELDQGLQAKVCTDRCGVLIDRTASSQVTSSVWLAYFHAGLLTECTNVFPLYRSSQPQTHPTYVFIVC